MRNIVKDGAWTSLPAGSQLRNEAPQVRVKPYQLNSAQLAEAIKGYLAVSAKDTKTFYDELYKGEGKDAYTFPYFSNDFRSFSSDYADTLSNITDRGTVSFSQVASDIGAEVVGAVAKVDDVVKGLKELGSALGITEGSDPNKNSPGTYIETPKFYQFANTDAPLSFSFPLLNTINEGDAQKNIDFIKEFTRLNKPERKNAISMTFPHIYRVKLKGLRFIRWAYCDSLSFQMVGQRRLIGKNMVPEAFICNMSFKSLTVEVANFLDDNFINQYQD